MGAVIGLTVLVVCALLLAVLLKSLPGMGESNEQKPLPDSRAEEENAILNHAMREIMINPEQAQLYVSSAYDEISNLSKQTKQIDQRKNR